MMVSGPPLPFGIDADTGAALPPLDVEAVPAVSSEPVRLATSVRPRGVTLPTVRSVDPDDLAHAGWGIVFGSSIPQSARDALQPLLEHRRAQTEAEFFQVFDGVRAPRPGESGRQWVERLGTSLQTVDPTLGIPYYVLIVASPDEIPFEFQYVLDIHWAVGRLYFETADEYHRYASSVIAAESMPPLRARQVAIFSTAHDGDAATQAFDTYVSTPLIQGVGRVPPVGAPQGFDIGAFTGEAATRGQLAAIYRGTSKGGPPALLFSGTHGVAFRHDDSRLAAHQGALLCAEWSGGKPDASHWFAASDVPEDANLSGLIQILFACYGGGCPAFDSYAAAGSPRRIAPHPLVARLPQALLAHPAGGALAAIAHVDRAWAHSFVADGRGPQIQGFRDLIGRLLTGSRAGHAMDQFNQRWASLSADFSEMPDTPGAEPDPVTRAHQWVARNDARNYVLFGDPAVSLPV